MPEGEQRQSFWERAKRKVFCKKGAIVLFCLAIVLAFVAFHNTIWARTTNGIIVSDVFLLGSFSMGNMTFKIPVDKAALTLNSGDVILIKTAGRMINATGNLKLEKFDGSIRWNGANLVLKGTLERMQSTSLDITWEQPEQTVITLANGLVEIPAMTLHSLSYDATGRLTLENKWTAKLNQTPFAMQGFEGRVYVQHVSEETTLGFGGHARTMELEGENVLRLIT